MANNLHKTESLNLLLMNNFHLNRLRQLRVRNGTCEIETKMQNLIKDCYAEFNEDAIDKEPFNNRTTLNHTSIKA